MAALEEEFPSFNTMLASGLPFPAVSESMATKKNNDLERANKKRRFADMETQQLDEIVTNAQAEKTKKATQWAVSVFTEWSKQKQIGISLAEMSIAELDENLRQFYAEARNREGDNYSRATLLSLRNGIERFLNTPPNNLGISLTNNSQFVLSNKMLDAKIKQLKKDGLQNTTHKPAIELEDLEKLKNGEILSLTQPLSLLRNVWFHISLFWCRRGFEGQRSLKKSSFAFGEDAKGDHFVTMSHDEMTKNHPRGVSDVESYEKNARMYKTNSPTDGYSALEMFLSKLNPVCEALFQYPKRNWRPSDKIWYENRPLGINKLSTIMKDISSAAGLHKSFSESDSDNLVGKCWPNKSGNYGDIWSPQRVEPSKLSQLAVDKSTSQLQRHPLRCTG